MNEDDGQLAREFDLATVKMDTSRRLMRWYWRRRQQAILGEIFDRAARRIAGEYPMSDEERGRIGKERSL